MGCEIRCQGGYDQPQAYSNGALELLVAQISSSSAHECYLPVFSYCTFEYSILGS